MATSMPAHAASSFAFETEDENRDDRPAHTHRSMPLHLNGLQSHAYSKVMPIESLLDFSHRNEKKRAVNDTPHHHDHYRPDWRGSQRSDDSFSAYVEHRVIESTPHRYERIQHSLSPVEFHNEDQYKRLAQGMDDQDERNASWPSTNIQDGDAYEEEENEQISASQQQQDEDDEIDGEADLNGEKKRRRRTNKAEASVLASVFAQTQFPDAQTREDLAKRLNMKAKAVSIWFQNRRQAMKKRASRFGGVEGVNGPTVTAATMQVFDVNGLSQDQHCKAEGLSADRLKCWMSLDDLGSIGHQGQKSITRQSASQSEMIKSTDTKAEETQVIDLSSAPILDLICRQRGKQQLSRMASLPSLASVMSTKEETKCISKRDIRDFLPCHQDFEKSRLDQETSTSSFNARLLQEGCLSVLHRRAKTQDESNDIKLAQKQSADLKEDQMKCVVLQGQMTFPAAIAEEIQMVHYGNEKDIWQRMQSSSSSSDGIHSSPDSNKENRDPNVSRHQNNEDEDENEDEEKTLRLIAGRRAAKEQAKKEKKLSEEGKRYLQEADARIALQQKKKRVSLGSQQLGQSILGRGLPSDSHKNNRSWNRAASEAYALSKSRMNWTRIPSLDMTAGRDRAKEDESNQDLRVIIEHRMASRLQARVQDENAMPFTQQKRKTKQINEGQQRHLSTKFPYSRRTPLQVIRNGANMPRSFVSSQSMPASNVKSKYSPAHSHVMGISRYDASRESKARLDGQDAASLPSSQEGSENGSDEWLEAWARERRKELQSTVTPIDKGIRERSAGSLNSQTHRFQSSPVKYSQNKRPSGAVLQQPTPRHDDSGFYGSDSDDGKYDGGLKSSKRRLVSQNNSSSPIKKSGDERDRLAAETLLGLGSRA